LNQLICKKTNQFDYVEPLVDSLNPFRLIKLGMTFDTLTISDPKATPNCLGKV